MKKTDFSSDRYGSLDEIIKNIEEEFTEIITTFVGAGVELELAEVTLFTGIEQLEDKPIFCQVVRTDQPIASFIGLNIGVFRSILATLLGSAENPKTKNLPLSTAENKLFLRFCRQLGAGLLNVLELTPDDAKEFEISLADDKAFNVLTTKAELVSIPFDLAINNTVHRITILSPMELLEPKSIMGPRK